MDGWMDGSMDFRFRGFSRTVATLVMEGQHDWIAHRHHCVVPMIGRNIWSVIDGTNYIWPFRFLYRSKPECIARVHPSSCSKSDGENNWVLESTCITTSIQRAHMKDIAIVVTPVPKNQDVEFNPQALSPEALLKILTTTLVES